MRKGIQLASYAVLMVFLIACSNKKEHFELPSIISNNMVLQQNQDVSVWGKAYPGSKILVSTTWGVKAEAEASSEGNWITTIKTPVAGGPFELSITSEDTAITLSNVMSGEVWLCSGQSNMEMTLAGWPPTDTIENFRGVIKNANIPQVRMYTVVKAASEKPQFQCKGSWIVCDSTTAGSFSATAFFFGSKLIAELKVPVGLINSSWGGTPAESWINKEFLEKEKDFIETIEKLDSAQTQFDEYQKWISSFKKVTLDAKAKQDPLIGMDFFDGYCSQSSLNDNEWPIMKLPIIWESTELGEFDGVVWFRKTIELPKGLVGKELILNLGPIDDRDVTYVNGKKVGGIEEAGNWQVARKYNIPVDLTKEGKLSISVKVIDTQGGGGIYGNGLSFNVVAKDALDGNGIDLAGEWKYLPVSEFANNEFCMFPPETMDYLKHPKVSIRVSSSTPTCLYNAMIAPVSNYSIKGAIWYQGEANVGRAGQYQRIFPALIECWRNVFKNENMPFYYVQIAPFNYGDANGTGSADIREAQRRTLSLHNTGMVVTLDIGNVNNIHPSNKKDVGERLASWALAKDYGKQGIIFTGPLYKSMSVEGANVIVSFDNEEKGLVLKPEKGITNFEIAGADSIFTDAKAEVKGNQVVVSSNKVKSPVAVRYCYKNSSTATLFNTEGLPASTFTSEEKLP